jgi:hypothetical protein
VREKSGKDLFVWGPRPKELGIIHAQLKAENQTFDVINKTLQNWYNQNKGIEIQSELLAMVQSN